jgi:hypothetical protein
MGRSNSGRCGNDPGFLRFDTFTILETGSVYVTSPGIETVSLQRAYLSRIPSPLTDDDGHDSVSEMLCNASSIPQTMDSAQYNIRVLNRPL